MSKTQNLVIDKLNEIKFSDQTKEYKKSTTNLGKLIKKRNEVESKALIIANVIITKYLVHFDSESIKEIKKARTVINEMIERRL